MFTVKLASGETFPVNVAEQHRTPSEGTGKPIVSLHLECTPAGHDLDWYVERLEAPGALERIEVYTEEAAGFSLDGFTRVTDMSVRLLIDGSKQLTITLCKNDLD